jgi:hypothetical protein
MNKVLNWLIRLVDSENIELQKKSSNNDNVLNTILERLAVYHIEKVYVNVVDMVRFAEAKNGILLTVNIAMFIEIAKYGLEQITSSQKIFSIITWLALLCSIGVLFVSFLPKLSSNKKYNPLYFGSIITSCDEDYKKRMKSSSSEELHDYYCEQIHINAAIAKRKFIQFKVALIFSIISLMSFGIIKLMIHFNSYANIFWRF